MKTFFYNTIKYLCDVKYCSLHACVAADKFAKGGTQYDANVDLKVNLKLNGTRSERNLPITLISVQRELL